MAYKTFANGFPLPASDLNNYLMNQSVIVFADAAARTAAIASPTEGMVTYLEDDNELYKWTGADWENIAAPSPVTTEGDLIIGDAGGDETRLPIGTAGQVLTANGTTATWEDAAGGGAWTELSTTSLSGSSTINLDSINQSYKFLKIEVLNAEVGTGGNIYIRFRNGVTNLSNKFVTFVTTVPRWDIYSTTNIFIAGGGNIDASIPFNYELTVSNYASTSEFKSFGAYGGGTSGADSGGFSASGACVSTSAIDSVQLISPNNFTAGTIRLLGGN